jgi:hypothetical protein
MAWCLVKHRDKFTVVATYFLKSILILSSLLRLGFVRCRFFEVYRSGMTNFVGASFNFNYAHLILSSDNSQERCLEIKHHYSIYFYYQEVQYEITAEMTKHTNY